MKQSMMWKRTLSTLGLMAALALVLFAFSVRPAAAAGIVVNSAADDIDAFDGDCTLREAIIAANNDTPPVGPIGECTAGSGADTITFAADYTITLIGSQLPAVTTEMTITGNGAANTIIQANAAANTATYRVFEVGAAGNLTLDGVTARHGRCVGACSLFTNLGGGILNLGMTTVINSTLSGNSADFGGGVYNQGTLTVTNSTLSGNSAGGGGGGGINNVLGQTTVTNSILSGNSANGAGADGGGILNDSGTLAVTNSTLSGNTADREGGGILNDIFGASTLTVTNSTLSGNSAGTSGGGISNFGTLTVTNSTLSGNSAVTFDGGGVHNSSVATVTNSTLSSNSADDDGGGIYNSIGTLTVTNSILSGNSAVDSGGGISSLSGTLTVTNSILSGNSAVGSGGGISSLSGTLSVINSTVSGNSASSGGGMIINSGATVTNSTITGNLADAEGGGLYVGSGNLTLVRSLVSGNSSAGLGAEITRAIGTITANANNVFGHSGLSNNGLAFNGFVPGANDFNATSDAGTPVALASILDTTLADNGGPTETHALVPGSPAIDLGPTAACAAAPVNGLDQRGEPRNVDGNGAASANECDAGAYEYDGPPAFCTGFPMSAGTEAELNEAITCYNLLVAAGSYAINLTFDIPLTASTVAIDNSIAGIELLLDGQGFAVDGQGTLDVRPFEIETDSDATFDDITITGGNIPDDGGGIFNDGTLTVTNSTLFGNSAGDRGGGIYNIGTLTVINSTLSGNTTDTNGNGGGIHNSAGGTATVTGSTLAGNMADSNGGGIYNFNGTLTVINSTLSGNSGTGGNGGGIYAGSGTTTVINSTLSGNSAGSNGGGLFQFFSDSVVTLTRSLVSGNSAALGDEIYFGSGTLTVDAFNVFGHSGQTDSSAFSGLAPGASDFNATSDDQNVALANILTTTLADNGGPTETHALVAGSPAIDFGPTAACAADPVFGADQRGEPRSIDIPGEGNDGGANLCDTGAFEVQLPPPAGFCPVDNAAVDTLRTDLIGVGMGSPTMGARNRKLAVPNYQDVDALYGQLAAVDVGIMKYVRFLPQGSPTVQIHAPTSPAYRPAAVDWWGTDLPAARSVRGQFFWGQKGNRAPRAFVLWPTYRTAETYANVLAPFDESSENHVYWDTAGGWIDTQTQVLSIPPTQAAGASVTVNVAVVDVNKDARSVILTVEAGGVNETRVITVPNRKDSLNVEMFVLAGVPAGTDEVTITLESPPPGEVYPFGGDSAAMIGASANYACEVPGP